MHVRDIICEILHADRAENQSGEKQNRWDQNLTNHSPSYHSGVLLHSSLQEALQDGPFSHGWSWEASTGHGNSRGAPQSAGFQVSRWTGVKVLHSKSYSPLVVVWWGSGFRRISGSEDAQWHHADLHIFTLLPATLRWLGCVSCAHVVMHFLLGVCLPSSGLRLPPEQLLCHMFSHTPGLKETRLSSTPGDFEEAARVCANTHPSAAH